MLDVVEMLPVTPFISVSHYEWLQEIQNYKDLSIQISLNENPMYFDEEGNRNYEEPAYQTVFRVYDIHTQLPQMSIYDYFEAETPKEAIEHIHQIERELWFIGFPHVLIVDDMNE